MLATLILTAVLLACGNPPVSPPASTTLPSSAPTSPVSLATPPQSPPVTKAASAATGEPIKVGVVTSLSGPQDRFGTVQKQGYDMALEEINSGGGVNGRPLQLIVRDDAGKPEQTITVVEQLITQDKVAAVIGSYASATTATAAPAATKYQTPLLIPSGGEDAILEQGSKWIFRICAPLSSFATTAMDFLAAVPGVSSVALVYENTNYGKSASTAAKKMAENKGIKVSGVEPYKPQDATFRPLLQRVKVANPEAIFFASYLLDGAILMREAKNLDLNAKAFIGAGAGFSDNDFLKEEGAGNASDYTFSVSQWTPDVLWRGAKEIGAKYRQLYGEVPQYHFAESYASLYVLADALKRAGSLDKNKIRDALAQTDMSTIFGAVKFDSTGQNAHPLVITQVQNGKFVTVFPGEVATGQAELPTPNWSKRQ